LQDGALAELGLGDAREPGEQDEEAVSGLSLADEHGPGCDLLALHAVGELAERLAREIGEQAHSRELGHRRRDVPGRHGSTVPTGVWWQGGGCVRAAARRWRTTAPGSSARRAVSSTTRTPRRRSRRSWSRTAVCCSPGEPATRTPGSGTRLADSSTRA